MTKPLDEISKDVNTYVNHPLGEEKNAIKSNLSELTKNQLNILFKQFTSITDPEKIKLITDIFDFEMPKWSLTSKNELMFEFIKSSTMNASLCLELIKLYNDLFSLNDLFEKMEFHFHKNSGLDIVINIVIDNNLLNESDIKSHLVSLLKRNENLTMVQYKSLVKYLDRFPEIEKILPTKNQRYIALLRKYENHVHNPNIFFDYLENLNIAINIYPDSSQPENKNIGIKLVGKYNSITDSKLDKQFDLYDNQFAPITSAENEKDFENALHLFLEKSNLNNEHIKTILTAMLDVGLKYSNIPLINIIKKYPDIYKEWEQSLSSHFREKLASFDSVEDPYFYSKYMGQFAYEYGDNTFNGALLVASQIRNRKLNENRNSLYGKDRTEETYDFDPTIITYDQFEEYLQILKATPTPPPIRERFLLGGKHWMGGEIRIEDGKAKLLFIDSLGANEDPKTSFAIPHIATFEKCFEDIPHEIYFDPEKRQNTNRGCFVYAFDDVRHLYTVERYLDNDLFDYLEKGTRKLPVNDDGTQDDHHIFLTQQLTGCEHDISLNITQLPLPLMRTAQTRKLISDKGGIISSRDEVEQKTPVKKQISPNKFTIAMDSAKEHFKEGKNYRIQYKLKSMEKQTEAYIRETPQAEIIDGMKTFTLDTLKYRLNNKYNPSKKNVL